MSNYALCQKYVGRPVVIREKNGRTHRGIIDRVDRTHVYYRPMNRGGFGGFGFGYYGGGYGYGYGYGYGFGRVALGFIAGVALATAFLW